MNLEGAQLLFIASTGLAVSNITHVFTIKMKEVIIRASGNSPFFETELLPIVITIRQNTTLDVLV